MVVPASASFFLFLFFQKTRHTELPQVYLLWLTSFSFLLGLPLSCLEDLYSLSTSVHS